MPNAYYLTNDTIELIVLADVGPRIIHYGFSGGETFTDFTDSRWVLGRDFLQLIQREKPSGHFPEQMSGLFNPAGWGVYVRSGVAVLKRTSVVTGARYPDFGCNFEVFTNSEFLELETLGPIVNLQPGEATHHTEYWWLFDGIPGIISEDVIRSAILTLVEKTISPE